jgi:hypothetical protein
VDSVWLVFSPNLVGFIYPKSHLTHLCKTRPKRSRKGSAPPPIDAPMSLDQFVSCRPYSRSCAKLPIRTPPLGVVAFRAPTKGRPCGQDPYPSSAQHTKKQDPFMGDHEVVKPAQRSEKSIPAQDSGRAHIPTWDTPLPCGDSHRP